MVARTTPARRAISAMLASGSLASASRAASRIRATLRSASAQPATPPQRASGVGANQTPVSDVKRVSSHLARLNSYVDGVEKLAGACVFEQEAAGAVAERRVDVLVEVERGEDEHARVREVWVGADQSRRFEPVELWHADVHQHDVREQSPREVDGFAAIRCLAGDLHPVFGGDGGGEAGADARLVVDDENADHALRRYGSSAATRNPCAEDEAVRVPPSAVARSRMPRMPTPRTPPWPLRTTLVPFSTV